MGLDPFYSKRALLAVFLFFLSLLMTFVIMAFLFPLVNEVVEGSFASKVLLTFVVASMGSNFLLFLNISIRYGIPFRGGDFWEWLIGDKDLGDSVKNGLIGCAILIGVFVASFLATLGVRYLIEVSLAPFGIVIGLDRIWSFLVNIVPAYEATNIFFMLFFIKNKEIFFFKSLWEPFRLKLDMNSSIISITAFFLASLLICLSIWVFL
jgi:hypothetical protein